MTEHTTDRLVAALREIPGVPVDMISYALDGYYDDYRLPMAFPITQLCIDLKELAAAPATPHDSRQLLQGLRRRVMDGEFDGTAEESEAWAQSPEGQAAFRELFRHQQ